jgi:CTP synthase
MFESVSIVLVGKYTNLHDSYLSVIKSLEHSSMRCGKKLNLIWVDAEHLEEKTKSSDPAAFHKAWHEVCTAEGILVPGGFGHRGTEGMVKAAEWARTNKTPYLGICLGMQIAVIEYARHVCSLPEASSAELNERSPDPVIIFMPEIDKTKLGGTMRLGNRPTIFQEGSEWSKVRKVYGEKQTIHERHRHRYEVNPDYIERLTEGGLHFVGKDDKGERMEVIELKDHPWYVGVQFHPEYLSRYVFYHRFSPELSPNCSHVLIIFRVLHPSPPYLGFVAAASGCLERITQGVLEAEHLTNGVGSITI